VRTEGRRGRGVGWGSEEEGESVEGVFAGYRHSAVVTEDRELYTQEGKERLGG
jgi:hypothetical protein